MKQALFLAGLLSLLAVSTHAEDGSKPICADRPGKGAAPCTVDRGHWQVEVDAADFTHDRSSGSTAETGILASTNFKYGVNDRLDLELNVTPFQTQHTQGGGSVSGIGDTVARAKIALLQGDTAVSLLPYVKLPTAQHDLGNGAVETGLVVPIAISLPGQVSLGLSPEVDAIKDDNGSGRHVAYSLAAGLSRPLSPTFTGSVELWGARNDEPSGHVSQSSFDIGLTWIPAQMQTLQLDSGLDLGLNHSTPQMQFYVGVSRRF